MKEIIFGSKTFQLSVKASVRGKGDLEDFQSIGINVFESGLRLVLDYFLESADVLEDATGIIAVNYAIELECERHAMLK
jgi:hypothetical protein